MNCVIFMWEPRLRDLVPPVPIRSLILNCLRKTGKIFLCKIVFLKKGWGFSPHPFFIVLDLVPELSDRL